MQIHASKIYACLHLHAYLEMDTHISQLYLLKKKTHRSEDTLGDKKNLSVTQILMSDRLSH